MNQFDTPFRVIKLGHLAVDIEGFTAFRKGLADCLN